MVEKVTHGYHLTQIKSQENIDTQKANKWLSLRLSSHVEGFVCALQEQEIDTKGLRKCREKDIEKRKRWTVFAKYVENKRKHSTTSSAPVQY